MKIILWSKKQCFYTYDLCFFVQKKNLNHLQVKAFIFVLMEKTTGNYF